MPTLFDDAARAGIHARIDRLTADRRPLWGKMNVGQMIVHLTAQLRTGLGELACAPKKTPLDNWLMRRLLIYVLPWPKGTPTAPELLAQPSTTWEQDLAALRAAMDRFAARGPGGVWAVHPAFGRLTGRMWGVLAWRHLDHHLRQFGA
ncbi:MAG TPA: DUF1569 domain-containing protein [Longimicrobium sp.]|jgi:hypothetical protein|nr:DUF1569 domain-containing protein [Longimicrobium sp.]